MKYLQFYPEKSKETLKAYKDKNGHDYVPTFDDNVPQYKLVDDKLKPVIKQTKGIDFSDPDDPKPCVTKSEIIISQNQLNTLIRMGQPIEVITPAVIEKMKAEKAAFEKALEDARIQAVEDYKKSLKKGK